MPVTGKGAWTTTGWACLLALMLGACSVPVARSLEEADANRIVVALQNGGVAASKEMDGSEGSGWSVLVARDQASQAVSILAAESLPPAHTPGVLEALGEGALVPSIAAEQARFVAGTAGELERSLRSIDRVLTARVHLAIPPADPMADPSLVRPPSASVLLRYRGATPPIAASEVQRLVAGAVAGLDPGQVSVVESSSPSRPNTDRDLTRVGPLVLSRSSTRPFKWLIASTLVSVCGLLAIALWSWRRSRIDRQMLVEASQGGATANLPPKPQHGGRVTQ